MLDPGIYSQMELVADDGESELLAFNHGPDCECGSEIHLFREHWEALGRPTLLAVTVFPVEEVRPVMGVVSGPWNQL